MPTSDKAPKGFYIGPSIQYIKFKERFSALEQQPDEDGDTEALYTERLKQRDLELYNVRVLLGYQFLVAQNISINPYAGPSFVFGDTDESFEREDENLTGFGLNFGVAIGLVF